MPKVKRDHDKEIEAFEQPKAVDPMPSLFVNPQSQNTTVETEHLKQIVKEAYSKRDIQLKTDLTAKQIEIMTRMSVYQKMFNSKVMNSALTTFMQLRVSHKRLGRKEFVQVAQSLSPSPQIEPSPIKKRLFGE